MNTPHPFRKVLLALPASMIVFMACSKRDILTKEPDPATDTVKTTISKTFPEINLKMSYSFSTLNDSSSKVEVSGDYVFIDNNATFYAPESTAYFTIRLQSKKDSLLQYFVNGKYHADTKELEIYYMKAGPQKK